LLWKRTKPVMTKNVSRVKCRSMRTPRATPLFGAVVDAIVCTMITLPNVSRRTTSTWCR
jgi:hypothetical protein